MQRFMFISLVCRRKIDAILELIRFSIDSKNTIALAQGARSLFEHVAVQASIEKSLSKLSDNLDGQSNGKKIHQIIETAEIFVRRCYYGEGPKTGNDKSSQAIHINDALKLLDSEAEGITSEYDFLCEYVHPNHGSNSLVSSSDISLQLNSIVADFSRDEVQRMLRISVRILELSDYLEAKANSRIAILGSYAHRFTARKAKVSNVFANKKIKPTGDGKSKETAYFFPTVRDHAETLVARFKYFQERNIEVYNQKLVTEDGGYYYDMYETSIGAVWMCLAYQDESGE